MDHLVISFVGKDQPGIVDQLSAIIQQHQGNWQNSSLHHLIGTFAGVIEVSASANDIQALDSALKQLPDLQVQTQITSTADSDEQAAITLELTANDRQGIVQDISSVIHHQGGNLIKLVSKQGAAPHTGQTMFNAKAQIQVNQTQLDELICALENLADDLMVDISQ
ncbi:glycine cleavage system protein R [Thalassotalea euphylliae]|uniref:Glycine cleavage system transcriptional repressor n=1 Tax=Thalassotalea euphylliae TaxID=1655234 RepID=A0A3E0U5X0_9GAMM|nr:ACT domain-containing protein [Thalassotalea euphylliae]REL32114.1 amino acid-binding protein [Thalassotalea euphylliae]